MSYGGGTPVMGVVKRCLGRQSLRVVGSALLLAGLMALSLAVSLLSRFSVTEPPAGYAHASPVQASGEAIARSTAEAAATPTKAAATPVGTVAPPIPPRIATRLVIPSLSVDAAVVEVPVSDGRWDVSSIEQEVAHLEGTANVGQQGNMVLAGHVTLRRGAGPFLHLDQLEPGDVAVVYAGGEAYEYRVLGTSQVAPDDLSVVQPSSAPTLTLLTCSDWDAGSRTYRQRFVVTATLATGPTPDAPRGE